MRDLIRSYKNTINNRPESADSGSESQPLLSSVSTSASYSASENQCMFQDSDTTDYDSEKLQKTLPTSAVSPKSMFMRRPFCFPGRYEAPTLDIFAYEEKIYERFINFSKINRILTVSTSSLIKSFNTSDSNNILSETQPTQNSLVTIFVIWNTIIGSSLLSMPWGLERTGFIPGIFLIMLVAGICLYTCNIFLSAQKDQGFVWQNNEISDLCEALLGKWAEVLAKVFSLIVLLGSSVVYWVLMSNFLFHSVQFLYGYAMSINSTSVINETVLCPSQFNRSSILTSKTIDLESHEVRFNAIWDQYSTVPVILSFFMFPLLNCKSPTFFTKFNSLGTISVMFLLLFVGTKGYEWGINIPNWDLEFQLKPTFCAFSGMLSLSYFIHNMITSIMKSNRNQNNNGRDLSIAFGLVAFTYIFVGVVFYTSFPLAKNCIQDNILNNFNRNDPMTITARLLLLFQLFTVFPLMSYVLRQDVFHNISLIYKQFSHEFTYPKVFLVNIFIVGVCVFFSCYLPRIGTLIRYTGAIGGLVYIFLLPSLMKIAILKKQKALTNFKFTIHILIIIFGVLNLVSQFFIPDT